MWEHAAMQELPGRLPEITEENLVESQPRVRALLMNRYEMIWNVVEGRIKDDEQEIRPLDPRLLEIGKGVLKEISALYRMSKPPTAVEEDPDAELTIVDRRELIAASLDQLEAKRNAQEEAARERAAAAQAARDAAAGEDEAAA